MTPTDEDLWRDLQVGDRVQIVHYPCEFSEHEYTMHDETRNSYRYLIDSKLILTVSEIDDDGYPWVWFEMVDSQERVEHHALMLNHDGIQRVR